MSAIRYRLGAHLGAGGMAEVFRATARDAQGREREVAVKRLLPAYAEDPKMRAMFGREAQVMARVRHPNLVALLDVEDDRDGDGIRHLVLELVEGTTLDRLSRLAFLPLPVVLHIVTELLTGLDHLHTLADEHGRPLSLVHRDVSPRNVLVSRAGEVKLGDFGLARDFAGTAPVVSAIRGTPCYMSPEQLQGLALDGRSDLFSAGVILWELLARARLFTGQGRGCVFGALLHAPIRPPGRLRPDMTAELEAVTMRLLERDRSRRFQSAREALDALHAAALPTVQRDPAAAPAATLAAIVCNEVSAHSSHTVCPSLPPAVVIAGALPGAAASAPARQVSADHAPGALLSYAVAPARPVARGRRRWLLAAGILLLLGSTTASMLLDDRDAAAPAPPPEYPTGHRPAPAQTPERDTGTITTVDGAGAIPQADQEPDNPAEQPDSTKKPGTRRARPPAAGHIMRDPDILPAPPGAPSALDAFVKEPLR